jgi:hypothetical protein
MCFSKDTYINSVLTEEVIQFQPPAANSITIPAGQQQGFHSVLPGRAAKLDYAVDGQFQDSP